MAADPYAALARQTEPADPAEAEYQAFYDALMGDERGRWFLAEFTRRNRNADTGLLLKALNRIEARVQLGSPDVLARLHQELRAILETIRASRAEAAADEIGETAKLLVLLAQVERRIDVMIGEPARAVMPLAEIAEEPPAEMRSSLVAVPEAAAETPAPAETATMMPPVAWTEPAPVAPEPAAVVTLDAIKTAEPETAFADMQPAPPVNENEPQAAAGPLVQPPAAGSISDDDVARAIADWTAASAADSTSATGSTPASVASAPEPAPMAFGDTSETALDSAADGFAVPDAAALTEPELHEWTAAASTEASPVEVLPAEAPEPAKTQALVLEEFEVVAEPTTSTPVEEPQAAAPEGPHVLPGTSERAFAPYEFEVLAQEPAAEATPAETNAADANVIDANVIEASTIDTGVVDTGAIETATPAAISAAGTATEAAMTPASAAPAPALDSIEARMAAANALAALAGLSEEERIALFT